jgi:hypothetical protein
VIDPTEPHTVLAGNPFTLTIKVAIRSDDVVFYHATMSVVVNEKTAFQCVMEGS